MCLRANISRGIKVVLRPLTSVPLRSCACDVRSLMPAKGRGPREIQAQGEVCGEGKTVFFFYHISRPPNPGDESEGFFWESKSTKASAKSWKRSRKLSISFYEKKKKKKKKTRCEREAVKADGALKFCTTSQGLKMILCSTD